MFAAKIFNQISKAVNLSDVPYDVILILGTESKVTYYSSLESKYYKFKEVNISLQKLIIFSWPLQVLRRRLVAPSINDGTHSRQTEIGLLLLHTCRCVVYNVSGRPLSPVPDKTVLSSAIKWMSRPKMTLLLISI